VWRSLSFHDSTEPEQNIGNSTTTPAWLFFVDRATRRELIAGRVFQKAHCGTPCKGLIPGTETGVVPRARSKWFWHDGPLRHLSQETTLAGSCLSRTQGRLCYSTSLWNGRDPIRKERLFGLSNPEGNHGEDVKEQLHYLDNTPTHSYAKPLYKYPQGAFPYEEFVQTNRNRVCSDTEYELIDTGILSGKLYFDVQIEYAKVDFEF
jgi:hypothetical protein